MEYLLLVGGLVLLFAGGEFLIKGAVATARRANLSPLFIGAVLVGFGTSAPELAASLSAALAGAPGIAVGNVIGSNIANVLLIIGVGAVLSPLICPIAALKRDALLTIAATLLVTGLVLFGDIGRLAGLGLTALLIVYVVFTYYDEKKNHGADAELREAEAASIETEPMGLPSALGLTVAGLAGVVVGADLLIQGAVIIARDFGLSEAVIGVTVVAIGTSLPELAAAISAVRNNQHDILLGNILGSNLFNILGILGITTIIAPLSVPPELAAFDIWVMLGSIVLLTVFAASGKIIKRWEGAVLLALYVGYIFAQFDPTVRGALGL